MRRLAASFAVGALIAILGNTVAAARQTEDLDTFCDAVADASILFNQAPDEDASKKKQEQFAKKVEKVLTRVEQSVPAAVASQAGTVVAAVRQFFETGEDPFEDPAVQAAGTAVDEYVAANCGYQVVDVTTLEYEFDGIPDTLEPGVTIFRLTNTGAEVHELALGKIKGDATAEELAEESPEDVEGKVKFASHALSVQGEAGFAYVNLKPGRYGAFCFIPVGTTDLASLEEEDHEGGEPHTAEGMYAEFEVER
jgi:hypothetical protein